MILMLSNGLNSHYLVNSIITEKKKLIGFALLAWKSPIHVNLLLPSEPAEVPQATSQEEANNIQGH